MAKKLPLTKKGLLNRAEKHIFSTGLYDGTSHICLANMKYGLAKMHYVQQKYGLTPDATFISSPDETISRNNVRWEQGISYGGRLSWGSGKDRLMMLDVKPNCCGMLVGGIHDLPKPKNVLRRVFALEQKSTFISDMKVQWDFYKGNHFIDIFKVEPNEEKLKLPRYAVIIHAGCPELKGQTERGMGLYWNMSKQIMEMCKTVKTPFGPSYTLDGHDAHEYYKFYQFAEYFAKKRREIAFRNLFDNGKIIVNKTHQGMVNLNESMLGCQVFDSSKELVPISIRADLPSYLVRGKHSFTQHQMDMLGFTQRAEEFGVKSRLSKANVLPHGGGYAFPDSLAVDKIWEMNNKRYFEIDMLDGVGKKIISNMKELQFTYRGREVLQRVLDLDMCEVAAVLHPIYTLKI
ncbi:hypothetical protein KY362_05950 [Candidatus Woesearchaeota archaeon]|nr:hypothetical protein [Candidatus Woesearchaeota archaeon]